MQSSSARPRLVVRAIRPTDAPALATFYAALSEESRTLRFLGATRGLGPGQAESFAAARTRDADGFIAVADGSLVGHLCLEPVERGAEEVAVVVADGFQGQGVGGALMNAALASAVRRGVNHLEASLLGFNVPMRRLLLGAGGRFLNQAAPDGTVRGVIDVAARTGVAA